MLVLGTAFIYTLSCRPKNVFGRDVFLWKFSLLISCSQWHKMSEWGVCCRFYFLSFGFFCTLTTGLFFLFVSRKNPFGMFSGVFFVVNSCNFSGLQRVRVYCCSSFRFFSSPLPFSVCLGVPFCYLIVYNTNGYTYIRLLEYFVYNFVHYW